MSKKSKVPQLRFSEFTDDWEQRKLGDLVERITRKNANLESNLPLTISAQYGLIDQNEYFDKRIASKDVSGYYLIKKGEFAYNKSTSSDAEWGAIKRLDRYEKGVLSTLYIVFKIINEEKLSSDFLVSYYETNLWHKDIQSIAAEGARNHGLLNIAPKDFFETLLTVPSNFVEQQKIGSFFKSLDNLITLHQRKLDNLKNIKKSMLQKLFPKKGEKYPEVRFKGFNGDWEQRKLSELANYSNGIAHEEYVVEQGKYELVTLKSINSEGELVSSGKFINKEFETLKQGTLIMMLSEQAKGMLGMTTLIPCNNRYILNQRVASLSLNNNVDPFFLTKAINKKQPYFEQMGAGTKVQNISKSHVENCVLDIPCFAEQHKIGVFFKELDNLITLHQRKLDNLKNIKKGFLQQMFA